jgi:hypothetical protein
MNTYPSSRGEGGSASDRDEPAESVIETCTQGRDAEYSLLPSH